MVRETIFSVIISEGISPEGDPQLLELTFQRRVETPMAMVSDKEETSSLHLGGRDLQYAWFVWPVHRTAQLSSGHMGCS